MQQYQDLLIDALLDQGFSLPEAERLIAMQERVEHQRKMSHSMREADHWLEMNDKRKQPDR